MQNVLAKHNYEYVTMPVSMDIQYLLLDSLPQTMGKNSVRKSTWDIQDNHDNIYYDFVTK